MRVFCFICPCMIICVEYYSYKDFLFTKQNLYYWNQLWNIQYVRVRKTFDKINYKGFILRDKLKVNYKNIWKYQKVSRNHKLMDRLNHDKKEKRQCQTMVTKKTKD